MSDVNLAQLFDGHVDVTCPAAEGSPEWLSAVPAGGGVYLLAAGGDELIQLTWAADLRRALRTRLLQAELPAAVAGEPVAPGPARSRRADLREVVRRIWWRQAHSAFELDFEYLRLARVLLPKDYLENLSFGPASFLHVDPDATAPRFAAGKVLRSPPGVDLGPFPSHKDAQRFAGLLEDAFDLCRYPQEIDRAPHGQACAYHDMGRCPAPCNGTVPMDVYRTAVRRALGCAAGDRRACRADMEAAMRSAAAELAFERAATIRKQLQAIEQLDHEHFALVRPIEQFNWLIVQRAGGTTRVRPFWVNGGWIEPGEPVRLKGLEIAIAGWIERLGLASEQAPHDRQHHSEHVWLVTHHLLRSQRTGLFLPAASLAEPPVLADSIRDAFARRPAAQEPETGASSVSDSPS